MVAVMSAGLVLLGPGCSVQGFDIHGFGVGIVVGSPGNTIQGNYIGTDPTGTVGLPNGDGMFRFSTTCCNTPIANTQPGRPWAGFHRRMFSKKVEESLGPVKSSIMGKYAKGTPPPGTPQTFDFKGMKLVLPYILKGILLGKAKHSPFFENGEAIVSAKVLSAEERQAARVAAGPPQAGRRAPGQPGPGAREPGRDHAPLTAGPRQRPRPPSPVNPPAFQSRKLKGFSTCN